jgi:3-oxoadipate CoA-transferase alpha subunit
MKNKRYPNFDAAVADIPNGATIMISGFAGPGTPRHLISALHRQGATGLTGILNVVGKAGKQLEMDALVAAGRLKKVVASFTATRTSAAFDEIFNAGELDAELVPQGTLAERIRSAGAGIGAFYTPTGAGTEVAQGKEVRTIDGRNYLLEYPLHADYAFVSAYRADTFGNLQYRLAQRNFGPLMAQAARTTIVEVETEIVQAGEMDPDQVHTPGVYVDRMVKILPPPEGILREVSVTI